MAARNFLLHLFGLLRDERGQVAMIFAMVLPAIALVTVGGIDLMNVSSARDRIQDIGDAAALAGATELRLATSEDIAIARANAFVEAHVTDWQGAPEVTKDISVVSRDGQRILQVRLDGRSPSFFVDLLPPGGWRYKSISQAVSVGVTPLCVLITSKTGTKALYVKDTGILQAPACLVHSNRDIRVEGGRIAAASVQAVTSALGMISPVADTGAASIPDPFADLVFGVNHVCQGGKGMKKATTGTVRLAPGAHCGGLMMEGDSRLILDPGEHWFLGGHLTIKDDARLTGIDVSLFFDKQSKFDFTDNALVNLDGRKTGPFAGMVMVAIRGNTQDFSISSDHIERLLGVVYVPDAQLIVEGNADVARTSPWTIIVAQRLELKGSPSLFINANYSSSDVPVPEGVGPGSNGAKLIQ